MSWLFKIFPSEVFVKRFDAVRKSYRWEGQVYADEGNEARTSMYSAVV